MMLCSRCNKRPAIVFVTKLEKGEKKNEGLCLTCAKELGMPQSQFNNIIEQMGITPEMFDEMSQEIMENPPEITPDMINEMMPMMQNMFSGSGMTNEERSSSESSSKNTKTKTASKTKKKSLIDQYATNLNQKATQGKIDRVIGRDVEIERVVQILNRRKKNNPALIGEPGVGKTAIAEGLAVKIVNGSVPHKLLDKEIYLLDLTSLVAGTQFRGQFEARIKGIIDEAIERQNVIFVIDEIHNIVATGDADGAMGAANILKPALAKGDIQVIGATTLDEYRKHIEKDSALERRFQPVIVEEPSVEQTIEIIKGIKDYYENHHKVIIPNDVIRVAAVLSERYITDRFLPDKAIDVIDEAGSRANLNNNKLVELEKLKLELKNIQSEKDNCVEADSIEDYQKAADLKIKECKLEENIKTLEAECKNTVLTTEDVARVIEMWTKIPVQRISEFESNKLMKLEERLHERLIGQNSAVEAVSRAIRINRAGLSVKKRPVSFIFVGPTGVGKTELVRQIAKELFDDEQALIRLDMSEYMEKHSVAKIIGSPPGYVGYDEAGQLTEKVRRRPYSVILLDEIEKAHPDIFNILLQILDEGRITDSHGKLVNFENCIIIMTSNAGSDMKSSALGFGASKEESLKNKAQSALKQIFRPEFLNRVDEIAVFDSLTKKELDGICRLMLNDITKALKEKNIDISYTENLISYIIEKGYDEQYGARPMKRIIFKEVENKIAELIITGAVSNGDKIIVDCGESGPIVINSTIK